MRATRLTRASAAAVAIAMVSAASAGFDASMYEISGLAPFTNLVASQDMASTPFATSSAFTGSGFVRMAGGQILDTTTLVTNVYRVTGATTLAPGGPTLGAGDMIFAYTVRLVSSSATTVQSLMKFQVGGLSFIPGSDVMDGAAVLGRGFLTAGVGVDAPNGGSATDLESVGVFGASHEWQWGNDPASHLGNGEAITLLLFTGRASVGVGFANLIAPLTQPGVNPALNGAPVLIPTAVIPAPGAVGLLGLAGAMALRRRR